MRVIVEGRCGKAWGMEKLTTDVAIIGELFISLVFTLAIVTATVLLTKPREISYEEATAAWVKVGNAEKGVIYAEPSTISKEGNGVKMWHLIDLANHNRTSSGKAYMSVMVQGQYDCNYELISPVYFSYHSEHMGGGEEVESSTQPVYWKQVHRGDLLTESLWKVACGK